MANRKRTRRRTFADRTSWQPRRRRHSGASGKAVALALLGILTVGLIGYVLVFLPFLWVHDLEVKGTKNLDQGEIEEVARQAAVTHLGPISSESLVLLNEEAVADAVKDANPDVARVTVTKRWPDGLAVDVTERESTLLWQSTDKFYLVDQQGIAFEQTEPQDGLLKVEDSTGLPVETGKQIVSAAFIKELGDIQREMQTAGFTVTGFRIPESTFEVQAVTDQGFYALFDSTRSIPFQVDALKRAVQAQKPSQYADLRVPGRVYVR